MKFSAPFFSILLASLIAVAGCRKSEEPRVVLYTSIDEPVARPIIEEFQKRTGIHVDLQTDTEANKSAGLAQRLQAETANPQADVWWGNEIFHTIRLADGGALAAYESPAGRDIPERYKDARHCWTGIGLRARMLARNVGDHPGWDGKSALGLSSLTDPALKGKIALAMPTAGTTGGHVAALYVLWGKDKADQFFRDLKANDVKLLGGNSVVADKIADGTLWLGLTDNDDADAALREGGKIEAILPDQGPDGQGTLLVPGTVGLVTGAKHAAEAKKLIDYLLSPEVEKKLIDARFAKYSVRDGGPKDVKQMNVDYRDAAAALPESTERARDIMQGRR